MFEKVKIRILSYNIHKGYDWTAKNYFIHDMRELINSSGADVVLLQEVIGQNNIHKKDGLIDVQFEFLAESHWQHHSYGKNAIYDHGHHGNLILSKFPILNSENVNLSTNSFEKRGLLLSEIQIPNLNRTILAGCLHLNLLHSSRTKQYEIIKNKVLSLGLADRSPLIIGGDFNDWNRKSSDVFENKLGMQDVYKKTHGHFAKTFPSNFPLLNLDRIYVKNLKILSSSILTSTKTYHLSDHLPLCCEVELED